MKLFVIPFVPIFEFIHHDVDIQPHLSFDINKICYSYPLNHWVSWMASVGLFQVIDYLFSYKIYSTPSILMLFLNVRCWVVYCCFFCLKALKNSITNLQYFSVYSFGNCRQVAPQYWIICWAPLYGWNIRVGGCY